MPGIPFNPDQPSVEPVREAVLNRLRHDKNWSQFDNTGSGFDPYVEYVGDERRGRRLFLLYSREVIWQLMSEGVLAPGSNSSNLDLPFFRVTDYGGDFLNAEEGHPHDPTGYLAAVNRRVPEPDPTVLAYLAESAATFRRGSTVASMVMLGVAAERVFDLLCESLLAAPSRKGRKRRSLLRYSSGSQ